MPWHGPRVSRSGRSFQDRLLRCSPRAGGLMRSVRRSPLLTGFSLAFVPLVVLLVPSDARRDPDTGKVRVLYIGDYSAASPYPIMEAEPTISLHFAWPTALEGLSHELAKKMFRQYIPRTYSKIAENDAMIISDADASIFEDRHYQWFRDAVAVGGSGLVMIGGNGGFGGQAPNPSWGNTVVQDILPVWCLAGVVTGGRVEILEPEHELLAPFPLEKRWPWMTEFRGNAVTVRAEAQLLADLVEPAGAHYPLWATWDVGAGRCFAMTCDWTPAGGVIFMRWPYYGDFAVNLMMYLSGNPIPSDLETVHKARAMYLDYRSARAYLFSVVDFAEKLGANTGLISGMVAEADGKHEESVDLYVDFEFEASMVPLEAAMGDLRRATAKAMKLKDQAMLWIYLIEWSVVTATLAVGGFVLWSLMVRRRLYREVGGTKFVR